jgi:hypothetical protein
MRVMRGSGGQHVKMPVERGPHHAGAVLAAAVLEQRIAAACPLFTTLQFPRETTGHADNFLRRMHAVARSFLALTMARHPVIHPLARPRRRSDTHCRETASKQPLDHHRHFVQPQIGFVLDKIKI